MFFTKDKLKAFSIHLFISATIVGIVFVLIFLFWYPRPYFEANGAWTVLRVLVMVDLVLGPLLTLVLFKRGKKGLVLDMCIVAAIQLAALIYGVHVIFDERPYYLAFAVDRFEVIGKVEIDANKIKYPELKIKPNQGPILVYSDFPKDKKERENFLFEVVIQGKPDLERRPEYYHPYLLNKDKVLQKAKPLSDLIRGETSNQKKIDKFLKRHSDTQESYLYLPLVGKNNDLALVLDKNSGLPVDGIAIDPW